MMTNPGKTVTLYQMGKLIGHAWLKALSPSNITSRFKVTGIWPFDKNIFNEDEFLPTSLTDRPNPNIENEQILLEKEKVSSQSKTKETTHHSNPGCSTDTDEGFMTPEKLRGYPKVSFPIYL